MLQVKTEIVTDASGAATVFLTHGINSRPQGFVLVVIYRPGTIDAGADLTITGETSGMPILAVTDVGASDKFFYPRALMNEVATGAAGTSGTELIPISDERIKVVVAQGGNVKTGSIEAILLADFPY
jgi:hypothetical protein